jgi:hypothetical protein
MHYVRRSYSVTRRRDVFSFLCIVCIHPSLLPTWLTRQPCCFESAGPCLLFRVVVRFVLSLPSSDEVKQSIRYLVVTFIQGDVLCVAFVYVVLLACAWQWAFA